jgi:peptidoglycan/LPS O-acetylase OafA/YrhL
VVLGPWLYNDYLDVAHTGVVAFFVISGFLITGLLLSEQELVGGIDLPRFYLRCTTRIAIPYLVFLAVVAAMTVTGAIAVPTKQFVSR